MDTSIAQLFAQSFHNARNNLLQWRAQEALEHYQRQQLAIQRQQLSQQAQEALRAEGRWQKDFGLRTREHEHQVSMDEAGLIDGKTAAAAGVLDARNERDRVLGERIRIDGLDGLFSPEFAATYELEKRQADSSAAQARALSEYYGVLGDKAREELEAARRSREVLGEALGILSKLYGTDENLAGLNLDNVTPTQYNPANVAPKTGIVDKGLRLIDITMGRGDLYAREAGKAAKTEREFIGSIARLNRDLALLRGLSPEASRLVRAQLGLQKTGEIATIIEDMDRSDMFSLNNYRQYRSALNALHREWDPQGLSYDERVRYSQSMQPPNE